MGLFDDILIGAELPDAVSGGSEKIKKESPKKKSKAEKKEDTKRSKAAAGVVAFSASMDEEENPHELPPGFIETLQSIIKQFCIDNDIESMKKAPSLQWGACCMLCGQYIKKNKILWDKDKTAARGGVCAYDIEKISQLLDIFSYLCKLYAKTALVTDFIDFSGVSRGWFFGTNGHNSETLTSAGGDIRKKLYDIQAAAVASGIVDGRENPTGKIYFSKAVLGWSETGSIHPQTDQADTKTARLPDFNNLGLPKL